MPPRLAWAPPIVRNINDVGADGIGFSQSLACRKCARSRSGFEASMTICPSSTSRRSAAASYARPMSCLLMPGGAAHRLEGIAA